MCDGSHDKLLTEARCSQISGFKRPMGHVYLRKGVWLAKAGREGSFSLLSRENWHWRWELGCSSGSRAKGRTSKQWGHAGTSWWPEHGLVH